MEIDKEHSKKFGEVILLNIVQDIDMDYSQYDNRTENHIQERPWSEMPAVDLVLDPGRSTVDVAGYWVHLSKKEYQVLEFLLARKGTCVTSAMLLNHLYCDTKSPEVGIIKVYISGLRKKLALVSDGHNYIRSVRGGGYTLCV